jgi:OOP family OmpA-OmpF porin
MSKKNIFLLQLLKYESIMNRIIATTILLLTFFTISAQEIIKKESKNEYNKWSVEVNIGNNKPIKPFSKGYSSSADNVFMKFPELNHFDIGVRRMFSTKFGLKLDVGSDIIENQKGSDSKPFHSQQNIVSLQTVYNIGKVLGFEGFTNRFGLLAHFGIQVSQLNGKRENGKKVTEYNGGIIFGLTPQVKLSDRFAVSGDFSFLTNTRQNLNWDGRTYSNVNGNLTGKINYFKLGLNYYLGENEKHADWMLKKDIINPITIISVKENGIDKLQEFIINFDLYDIEPDISNSDNFKKIINLLTVSDHIKVIIYFFEEGGAENLSFARTNSIKNIIVSNNINYERITISKKTVGSLDKKTIELVKDIKVILYKVK